MATKLTSLKLGGAFAAGVVSALTAGQLLIGGDIVTDSTQNSAPSLVYDSGSYLTYQETRATNSGTYALYAQLSIPSTYGSGALMDKVTYECRGAVTQGYDLVVSAGTVANGTGSQTKVLLNNFSATADSVTRVESGTLIPVGHTVIAYAGTGASSATDTDCKLKLWTSEQY